MKDKELREKVDDLIYELSRGHFIKEARDTGTVFLTDSATRLIAGEGIRGFRPPSQKHLGVVDRISAVEEDMKALMEFLNVEKFTEPKKSGIHKIKKSKPKK